MITTGSLCVPNVGLGDIEVRFNQHDSAEGQKALRMLLDMQQRGYAILVRLDDGSYVRATSIDAERGCYIVQLPDAPEVIAAAMASVLDEPIKKKRGRPRKVSIPIGRAHAVGIARSAGG